MANAQDSYVVDKEGNKTTIIPKSFDLNIEKSKVTFKTSSGQLFSKSLAFKDFDYAVLEDYRFQSFDLWNTDEYKVYSILAESDTKKLISYTYTIFNGYQGRTYFNAYVLNKDNSVYQSFSCSRPDIIHDDTIIRDGLRAMITENFPDCTDFLEQFKYYDKPKEGLTYVLNIFEDPTYHDCKTTK